MRVPSTDGVELELHDLGGAGPPLLIAHATGMCAGAYLPMVPQLARHFHVWGIDFRAHGDSTAPTTGDLAWSGMAADVLAAADALGDGPIAAVGHSMGGASLVAAERERPGLLTGAFLFEPIIIPGEWGESDGPNPMADAARRRRPGFASRDEAIGRYARRPPLGTWRADALAAYVDHGFRDDTDSGGVHLKCTPEHEAQTFEGSGKITVEEVGSVETPIVVARGGRDGDVGPAGFAGRVVDALPHAQLRRYRELSHFGPFEDPELIGREAVAFLAK